MAPRLVQITQEALRCLKPSNSSWLAHSWREAKLAMSPPPMELGRKKSSAESKPSMLDWPRADPSQMSSKRSIDSWRNETHHPRRRRARVAESVAYYEAKEAELGRRFRNEVVAAVDRICRSPELPRLRAKGYRRFNLRVFPHYIATTSSGVTRSGSWRSPTATGGRNFGSHQCEDDIASALFAIMNIIRLSVVAALVVSACTGYLRMRNSEFGLRNGKPNQSFTSGIVTLRAPG